MPPQGTAIARSIKPWPLKSPTASVLPKVSGFSATPLTPEQPAQCYHGPPPVCGPALHCVFLWLLLREFYATAVSVRSTFQRYDGVSAFQYRMLASASASHRVGPSVRADRARVVGDRGHRRSAGWPARSGAVR